MDKKWNMVKVCSSSKVFFYCKLLVFSLALTRESNAFLFSLGSTSYEAGNEEYRGSWHEDKMQGFGVYKYIFQQS